LEGLKDCDFFGVNVAMAGDGDSVVVGSSSTHKQVHVRVYKYENEQWNQVGANVGDQPGHPYFGQVVDISRDGSRVIVAPGMNWNNGYARVYENQKGQWTQLGGKMGRTVHSSGFSLISAALSGDGKRAIIGTYGNEDEKSTGQAIIFQYKENGEWLQVGDDILLDVNIRGEGGESGEVAISHDGSLVTVTVPSTREAANGPGYVRVYKDVNGKWIQLGDDITGDDKYDRIGTSAGMSEDGGRVIIGAQSYYDDGSSSGHALVYDFGDETTLPCVGNLCEE